MSAGPWIACPLGRDTLAAYALALDADGDDEATMVSVGRHLDECAHCLSAFGQVLSEVSPHAVSELRTQLQLATVDALLRAVNDPFPEVRLAAIEAVARLGGASLDSELSAAVARIADGDENAAVREAASALRLDGASEFVALLEETIGPDPETATAARKRLGDAIARLRAGRKYLPTLAGALAAIRDHSVIPWELLQPGSLLPTAAGSTVGRVVLRGTLLGNACRVELVESDGQWQVLLEVKDRITGESISDIEEILFVDPSGQRESVDIAGPRSASALGLVFDLGATEALRLIEINRAQGQVLVFAERRE